MARDELDVFAQIAREFCAVMEQAAQLSLTQRVFGLYNALGGALSAGATLPIESTDPPARLPRVDDFPGLGSYEPYWSVGRLREPGPPVPFQMTEVLQMIYGSLIVGLRAYDEGNRARAAALWGAGFEGAWGAAASELVHALHPVVAAYRNDLRRDNRRERPTAPVLVQHQAPPETEEPEGLGIEFVPCPGGLEITAVHSRSAAAGKLRPGDLVITINGRTIDELEPDDLDKLPLKFELFRGDETLLVTV